MPSIYMNVLPNLKIASSDSIILYDVSILWVYI